jgi:membrane protein DedA with SNARE-associated domain
VTIESFVHSYGYLAVLVGTFFEGETVLVLGAYFAQRGYLVLEGVIAMAFLGTLLGDQLAFWVGRRFGRSLLARHPRWQARVRRAGALVARHQVKVILGFRFVYGLRTATPFALGMGRHVRASTFVALNLIGAFVWAVAFGLAGYAFGTAVETLLARVEHYEAIALVIVVALGVLVWLVVWRRGTRLPP